MQWHAASTSTTQTHMKAQGRKGGLGGRACRGDPQTCGSHLPGLVRQQLQRATHAARRQRRQPHTPTPSHLELLMDAGYGLLEVGRSGQRACAACKRGQKGREG